MSRLKVFVVIGVIAVATLVVGASSPAFADPTGTTFFWAADNFQGDSAGEPVPFGVPTPTSSGITVDSSVSVSPSIPSLFLTGGKEYIEFSLTTTDGGYIADTPADNSAWAIAGLNWGPGEPPAVATGLIFISFDADGTYLPLDGTGFEIPIVPNPGTLAGVTGADALPLDIAGDPVDTIPWDISALTEGEVPSMGALFLALGMDVPTAFSVTSMHIGLEIMHVPEPTSMALLGTGLCSVMMVRRRRR